MIAIKDLIVITGPTASGKTALSVRLAKELGAEIVNADSMQIYKYMDIGTAKVTEDEMDGVVHHLIDVLEPDDDCNVSRFVEMAEKKIEEVSERGKLPVICGGTGLYIDSLLKGAAFEDNSCDDDYRAELSKIADDKGAEYLHGMLKEVDPAAAENIHPNNIKRVIRALEFFHTTGQSITVQKQNTVNKKYNAFIIGMERDREKLYENINLRVDKMVDQGLFQEVESLLKKGYSLKSNSMQAIGYREVIWYFKGKCTKEEAINLIKRNSRRYAKRQMTWFGANESICWVNPQNLDAADEILSKAKEEFNQ